MRWGYRRMDVLSEGGQGPEAAVASYIGGFYVDNLFDFFLFLVSLTINPL